MTLKDIAKQLTTAVQTVPNLVQILRDGFEQAEGGSSDAHNYSTTEHVVGKWIDDADLYEKTVSIGTVDAGTSGKNVAHGISNLGTVVEIIGTSYNTTENAYSSLPRVDNDASYQRYVLVTSTDVKIGGAANAAALTEAYITIRYTKNVSE